MSSRRRRTGSGIMLNTQYKKQPLEVNENIIPTVLLGPQGCANLVAIYNLVSIKHGSKFGGPEPFKELFLKNLLKELVQEKIKDVVDISDAEADGAKMAIANIRTDFALLPRLGASIDFEPNGLTLVCRLLNLTLLHGWVLDPEDSSYDILKDFNLRQVEAHYQAGNSDLETCKRLMDDASSQLTPYGFQSLANWILDEGVALIFCRGRLDVIHKRNGALFIYVVDEAIRERMPKAFWMVFEERQGENIYFTDQLTPVKNQLHKEKALRWYKEYLVKLVKDEASKEDKGESSGAAPEPPLAEPAPSSAPAEPSEGTEGESSEPSEASETQAVGSHHTDVVPQQDGGSVSSRPEAQSVDGAGSVEPVASPAPAEPSEGEQENSEPIEASETQAVGSDHTDVVPQQDVGSVSSRPEAQSVDGACSVEPLEASGAQAVGSHHTDVDEARSVSSESSAAIGILTPGGQQDGAGSVFSPLQAQSVDGDLSVSSSESSAATAHEAKSEDNSVPKGDGAVFLEFLNKFKDNGCSTYYFEGIVAAFALQKPRFYVPYEFIMAFNEPLALKIQDNFSGIYEDLRKAVVFYLSTKGVKSPDAVLKILGLPAAKSVQLFLDFLETIMLHEYYSYGEFSQAVPSYDSRRMSLGYLDCLVAKFKTGRCWAGKWSEANMKVLNGSKFVIDLDEDCVLDPESGFLDLNKFCITVLNRLKVNGQFPPYFDELAEDYMLINKCFGKPDKWARFLQLISNPLALKPPLVRAAFICNVYIAGDANSSGNPPTYSPLSSMKGCIDRRAEVHKHSLLMKVYTNDDRKTRKFKNLIDIWSPKHWHMFKFSRHFIHHVLGYTKGDDLIQKINDISVVDLLLASTIFKAIARSFRFLVLNCGVDGIFSSAWRHYVGSNYDDKPCEEDTTTDEMLQGLLNDINNTSEQNRRGYVYCEISVYSAQYVSVLISDAELTEIQNFLNGLTLECLRVGAYLQCGSIKLWKRIHPAAEESSECSVVVVEGPYSAEYDTVFCTGRVSGLATYAVNIEKADGQF